MSVTRLKGITTCDNSESTHKNLKLLKIIKKFSDKIIDIFGQSKNIMNKSACNRFTTVQDTMIVKAINNGENFK